MSFAFAVRAKNFYDPYSDSLSLLCPRDSIQADGSPSGWAIYLREVRPLGPSAGYELQLLLPEMPGVAVVANPQRCESGSQDQNYRQLAAAMPCAATSPAKAVLPNLLANTTPGSSAAVAAFQPGCQLAGLLGSQVHAVVDALHGLPEAAFGSRDFMGGEEVVHFIT